MHTPLIPALGKQRQEDLCEFQISQDYTEKPCLENHLKAKAGDIYSSVIKYLVSIQSLDCMVWGFFKRIVGAEEMAQCLRAPTALPEDLSSIPINHMVAHTHL